MNITPIKTDKIYKDTYKCDSKNPILAKYKSKNIKPIIEKNLLPHDYGYHPNIYKIGTVPEYLPPLEYGQLYDKRGGILNRHTTFFARGDLDWYDFGKYLKSKFEDISNVDIQCFGCSTGQEAYTLAILLNHIYNGEPFTIHASDIDERTIEHDKEEQETGIYLEKIDCLELLVNVGIDKERNQSDEDYLGKYFALSGNIGRICPEIVNSVEFSKKNILTSTDELNQTKPSIVLCRNMWPYVNPYLYHGFAEKLYENLAEGSIVIIGNFDCLGEFGYENSSDFPNALKKAGFNPVDRGAGVLCYIGGRNDKKLIFEK